MTYSLKPALMGAALSLSLAGLASAQTTLVYTEGGPNRGTRSLAVQDFADTVSALTNGEVVVDIHWGGALVGLTATLGAVRDGVADAGSVLGSYDPRRLIGYGVGDLPTQYSDPWVIMRAMYEMMTTNQTQIDLMANRTSSMWPTSPPPASISNAPLTTRSNPSPISRARRSAPAAPMPRC